jgi:hypothetical protein
MPEPATVALPTVTGADLPRQAYAYPPGHDLSLTQPELFRPVTSRRGWVKPDPGTGLWTATVTEATPDGRPLRTSWTDWCEAEQFGSYTHLVEVFPAADARVLRIDTLDDLRAVVAAFPAEPRIPGWAVEYPDWEALATSWDGVWLTDAGQWRTRLPPTDGPNLYGWDCESVLWLQPAYAVGEAG